MSSLSSTTSLAASSLSAGSLAPPVAAGGLISGLNTNQIIQAELAVEQQKITALTSQQSKVNQQEAAFQGVQSRLITLQGTLGKLANTFNSVFGARTVTASDPTQLTAAASSTAVPGVYSLKITALAAANQIASNEFATANAAIPTGPLKITVGGSTQTITLDTNNNTVSGLASAINSANAGLTATVINDGSATPYRLLLTSNKTGLANAITLDTSGLGGSPALDFNDIVQPAADAAVKLGSGPGALTVTSSTNTINGLINGVTLNLQGVSTSTNVTLTVANDTATAQQGIQDFVSAYNSVLSNIDSQSTYDATTRQAGVLLGNQAAISIEERVRNLVTQPVAGANPSLSALSALGITSNAQGQLQVDQAKLTSVLSGGVAGVTLNDVQRLFALTGQSTNLGVQFVSGDSKTRASASPYQVNITQAAQQASITATTALTLDGSGNIAITAGLNDSFTITVDGTTSGTLTLAANSYTPTTLAQALQSAINGNSQLAGRQVTVGVTGSNKLTITSNSYGSGSQVTIGSGSAVPALGFGGTESNRGQDVAGSFTVNGQLETATGHGQFLEGNATNANTADLQVRVTLTSSQVQAGSGGTLSPAGNLTVTSGLAAQLNTALNTLLDPVTGRLHVIDQGLKNQVDSLQKSIDQQNAYLQARQAALTAEFAALENTLAQLQASSNFLGAQTTANNSLNGTGTTSSGSATGTSKATVTH